METASACYGKQTGVFSVKSNAGTHKCQKSYHLPCKPLTFARRMVTFACRTQEMIPHLEYDLQNDTRMSKT